MANFGQLILTSLGLQAQINAQSGGELKFKRIAMGSGVFEGNAATLTSLVVENVSLPISDGYIQNNAYTVEGLFSNEDLHTGFEWREVGVFIEDADGNEILYCYANAGDAYDYIPATEDERYSKYIRIAMVVGNTTNVSIVESEGLVYVDTQTFKSHTDNKNNPHGVTKEHVGLGKVPNVSTNEQTPTYSDITTLATLSSGEKLNIAFQKIKCAISNLITHIASHKLQTYVSYADIGLTIGSESIEGIVTKLPDNSQLFVVVGADGAKIYPATYGVMYAYKKNDTRTHFEFFEKSTGKRFYGVYDSSLSTPWQGWNMVYTAQHKPSASDISATPWTLSYADTFETFWNDICTAAGGMGMVAFRTKDTGGWGPTKAANTWLNGVAFWQNPHTGTDDVNGTIILRLHSTSNSAIYKGIVTGNTTSGYTLVWHKLYDTNNKPTLDELGAADASTHNIKTYTNLSQLGLANGATMSQVARALPGSSILRIYVLTSENANLAPTATNGWLEVNRPTTNHAELHYMTSSGKSYVATVLNIGNASEQVSGWTQQANISDVPSKTENFVFTLEDGSTVTKVVYVG